MKQNTTTAASCQLWMDAANRILSFQSAEGFEPIPFPSREEMFAYVIEKGAAGYRIQ